LDVTSFEIINGSWSGKVLSVAGVGGCGCIGQVATEGINIV
jgi:hypothetical protein